MKCYVLYVSDSDNDPRSRLLFGLFSTSSPTRMQFNRLVPKPLASVFTYDQQREVIAACVRIWGDPFASTNFQFVPEDLICAANDD